MHLLILDIDETLAHATNRLDLGPSDFSCWDYEIYRRPYLNEFLAEVSQYYELAVWSSAGSMYVPEMIKNLFPEQYDLRFVWSGVRCNRKFNPEIGDYFWIKDLKKVRRLGYNLDRVVMIDDSPEKLSRHYGNLVKISPFEGNPNDTELRDMIPFLKHLSTLDNVRCVEKRGWRQFC